MPCNCPDTPCACPSPATSRCNLYTPGVKNVWIERGNTPNDVNVPGICMLDTMDDEQVIFCLERDERAREDLLKITTDPHLLELARTVPRLPVVEEMDAEQAQYNRAHEPASIPFYALFRGQPPFNQ